MKTATTISVICGMLSVTAQAVVYTTVSTYDATGTNDVDTDATGTLNTFKAAVAVSSAAGFGGVANFDQTTVNGNGVLDFTYASAAKTLRVTSSINLDVVNVNLSTGSVTPITLGTINGVATRPTGSVSDTTFTIGAISGREVNERVTSFAFTILSRNTYGATGRDFTATVFYSDLSNSGPVLSNVSNSKGDDDTFWSFTAPGGLSITSIFVDAVADGTGTSNQPVFDDIAFETSIIPEPSSVLLITAGLGSLGMRRRRA